MKKIHALINLKNVEVIKSTFLFILIIALPCMSFSQGTVKGIVSDTQSGETLPGANIVVKDPFIGTASNFKGEYILNNVPAGTNTIVVTWLGYEEKELTVEVVDGQTTNLDIQLSSSSINTEEVIVLGQAHGQRAAINQQMAANTVVNIVSAEKMEELPDANAAEAIGRLPGISLKRSAGEANKVVIRGLSPKYNNVTIEGIKMASTNDYDRSVDLSMVQSEVLSGIEVSKSLRPDMDADALGGTINLRLMEAPDRRKMDFNVEGGYSKIANNFNNYKLTAGYSERYFNSKVGFSIKASHEQKQMPSHQFSGGYSGKYWNFVSDDQGNVTDSLLNVRTQSTTLIHKDQIRKRTNGTAIVDFKNDWWQVKFYNLLSIKNDDITNHQFQYIFNPQGTPANFSSTVSGTAWNTMTRTHSLQNTFRFGASKLDVDFSTTFAKQTQNNQSFPFIESNDFGLDQNWLVYRQPIEVIDEIGGASALKIEDSYLQSLNKTNQQLTDNSYDAKIDYELSYNFGNISGKLQLGGKYHQLTRVSDGNSEYYSFEWGGGVGRRQAFIAAYPWVQTDIGSQRGLSAHNFIDEDYAVDNFLNGRYDVAWSGDIDLLTGIQDEYSQDPNNLYFSKGVESYQRDYQASEQLFAGYIMTEINVGPKLMLLPGVRYERNATEYFAYHIKTNAGQTGIEPNPDSITTNRLNAMFFPSLNVKYKATEMLSIQGAIYKSTSRPSFRQISPLVIYNHTNSNITSNNPYLNPSTALNIDLGASLHKSEIGLLTVYGFYKQINDLVFNMQGYKPNKKGDIVGGPEGLDDRLLGAEYYDEFYLESQASTNLPFNNSEKAYVKGLELSWQTNFWYLPGALKGLVLDVNYTLLHTETKYPYFQQVQIGVDNSGFIPIPLYGQEYMTRTGPMQDQPASILNVILGFDYKGFSGRVSYRNQSRTVESLDTRYEVFDKYYDTFSLIDVMLNQNITKQISVYANLTNLGNHVDDYLYGAQEGRPALPTKSEFYGFRAQFGVRVKL